MEDDEEEEDDRVMVRMTIRYDGDWRGVVVRSKVSVFVNRKREKNIIFIYFFFPLLFFSGLLG